MLTANVVEGVMGKIFERRKNGRFKCKRDALHNTDAEDLFFRGEVRNYSKRGMYFESNVDLQRGDNISILVEKQSTEGTQLIDVKIVWRKELQGLTFDLGYGAIRQRKRDIDYIKNKLKAERHYDK